MASYVDFHTQLASIMEVLANAAVAEICQLVDDGFATLRLEISRSQRENLALKTRLQLMEGRSGEQSHRERTSPPLLTNCTRTDRLLGEDSTAIAKRIVKSAMLENTDAQQSQPVVVTEHLVEPEEAVVVKKERLEEELTGCSMLEDHQTTLSSISTGLPSVCLTAQGHYVLSVEAEVPRVSASAQFEKEDSAAPEALQQVEREGVRQATTLNGYSHPADQNHQGTPGFGPNRAREMTDLTKDEHVADPSNPLSAQFTSSRVPEVETPLDSELSLTDTGVKSLCCAAEDSKEGAGSTAVKLEAETSWTQSFLVSVNRTECLSNSKVTNSQHTESELAELDTSSLESSSFDDLFSSPEVAGSLADPHKHSTEAVAGMEEPLSSSSFPFLSSFGGSSVSDSVTASSFTYSSSDSKNRSFPSRTEQVFSCQQCACLFSTSRDLVVHQHSHAGERIYHCQLCKKPFLHPHQLKTHQRVHTGEKPFSCAQCGKRFSQSSHIKRHMSVHTGEKRYCCGLCGKRFSQACSLKVHQAVHTGERPYSCTKCGKSFSVLGNLVRHQSVHISK
uniref:zinc finger protein with KRAB and SCAN domains 8 n=1 Tax=Scatophagus argus TaxID=75038 RepID=UPI001ED7D42C|nr:zinc finger protein with KRAB and SCAN domains 8 [Scatophagus argus]